MQRLRNGLCDGTEGSKLVLAEDGLAAAEAVPRVQEEAEGGEEGE